MPRFFNTTGPCDSRRHYMLPPEARIPGLLRLVEQELYFVVHAARQTGKTTTMRAFAAHLRGLGYAAVWATLETSQGVTLTAEAEPLWLGALATAAEDVLAATWQPPAREAFLIHAVGDRLRLFLRAWSAALPVPLVLLLDEADTISGPAMISLLRQLRAGFMDRAPGKFPVSVALIGMRDLRDYLTEIKTGVPVNPGSPFNIKSESITLKSFTEAEVQALYHQHTNETGQRFSPAAVQRAFYWTQGQPFLVNALARQAVMTIVTEGQMITEGHIDEAKERLILSRTTHLDTLNQRLKEERVARVIQAVLLGDQAIDYGSDDYMYCVDLGLIIDHRDGACIANPMYREVLVRELSYNQQRNLPKPWWKWQTAEGKLDLPALIDAFLDWWRENAEMVEVHAAQGYLEAVPHLAFMGFLQRVVNGGGRIVREFAAGREALDLVVEYAGERFVIELKRIPPTKTSLETIKNKGKAQISRYLDTLNLQEGWLLIFDQRPQQSWQQRLWREEAVVEGRLVHLRGA